MRQVTDVDHPVVSVVLCTYNRSHLLTPALDALLRQGPDTPPYEVIVVDNNSADATRQVVEPFIASGIVRYAFEPSQGLSHARNHGLSIARADLIAFTDDDVRVTSTWIRSIVDTFAEHPDLDMAPSMRIRAQQSTRADSSGRARPTAGPSPLTSTIRWRCPE